MRTQTKTQWILAEITFCYLTPRGTVLHPLIPFLALLLSDEMKSTISFVSLAALIFTGEGFEFLAFASKYPHVLWQMILFSVASALGQVGYLFII
jgi:hypothetical protein